MQNKLSLIFWLAIVIVGILLIIEENYKQGIVSTVTGIGFVIIYINKISESDSEKKL